MAKGINKVILVGNLGTDPEKKGSQVYIEGSLRTRKWQDQGGQDRYTTEIVGSEMQMLGSRSGGNTEYDQSSAPSRPAAQSRPQQKAAPQGQSRQAPPPAQNFDDFDDDIPF